jgi:DNA-binding response OmpR family regulator
MKLGRNNMSPATKILIVEDENLLAENMKSFLSRSASNIRIAGDANGAMEILQSFTPDIVVLDYGLPGMDGLQTYVSIVHSRAPKASCVMISGQLTEHITRTSYASGIHHILRKPFSFAELQVMIDLSLIGVTETISSPLTDQELSDDYMPRMDQSCTTSANRRGEDRRGIPDRRELLQQAY